MLRSDLASHNWLNRFHGGLLTVCCILMAVIGVAGAAAAAQVSGTLVAYEGGPQRGRSLHFQNQVTRDCYMVLTGRDGSFGTQLPPGVYAVRAERGAILARGIVVGNADVGLGQVSDLAPYAPARLWQLQAIAPSLLKSPAPSTMNILIGDTAEPVAAEAK